jgi:hypothetical protein
MVCGTGESLLCVGEFEGLKRNNGVDYIGILRGNI